MLDLQKAQSRRNRRPRRSPAFECAILEPRLCLHAEVGWGGLFVDDAALTGYFADPIEPDAGDLLPAGLPLTSVPSLSSNPGAPASLYLDFDGDAGGAWGGYNVPFTPAYDQDGDAATFSDAELANIRQIWARAAEKYSPFSIDVTTVRPSGFANKGALQVVIGGSGAWLGASAGGVAYVGSFYNSVKNTVYVFEDNLGNGNAKYTAEAATHEAGHAFGLQHQSAYGAGGNKTQEYNPGTSAAAPVMGNSYYATRGLWANGATTSATTSQDNLAVLAGLTNGFGYRADDHGNGTATAFSLSGSAFSLYGIIEKSTDKDFFAFSTGGGAVSFTGGVAQYGAMLDLKLELWDSAGTMVASADTATLGETLAATLAAGSYYIAVASHGGYGDIGQYTLTGSVVAPEVTVAAPDSLTATAVAPTQVNLAWQDRAGNETAFAIQRSTDGGLTWTSLATINPDVTSYSDLTVTAGVTYLYRVQAVSGTISSGFSNTASATPVQPLPPVVVTVNAPAAPSGVTATRIAKNRVRVAWRDNSTNESGFRIQRSRDGLTWSTIGAVRANATLFTDLRATAGTWSYRVIAYNASGDSPASEAASNSVAASATRTKSSLSSRLLSRSRNHVSMLRLVLRR